MRIFGIVVSLLVFWPVVSDAACRKEPVPEESSPDGAIVPGLLAHVNVTAKERK